MRRYAKTICVICVFLLLAAPAYALGPDSGVIYDGIDVSEFQGDIDFSQVKAYGIDVVYIRAGLGSDYLDPYFKRNVIGANRAGLEYGAYWFVNARSEDEAREQAAAFADRIRSAQYTCRPAMDFGERSGLSTAQFNAIALAFMEELAARTGVTPMLYTDAYGADRVYDERFGRYPLWVANYGVSEPDVNSGYWEGWSGFQYGDDSPIPGIRARVDHDRFTDTVLLNAMPEEAYAYYIVRMGDTLGGIAARFDATVAELASLNGIADANRILVGQTLRIPVGELFFAYTVQAGDTLYGLAERYGTTVEILAERNRVSDISLIAVGQRLWIPRR